MNCEQGRYTGNPGASICMVCAPGLSTNGPGSTACVECVAGRYKNSTMSSCMDCPAGLYQNTSARTACDTCAAGLYAPAPGETVCTQCALGKFSNTTAAIACTTCGLGLISNQTAPTTCHECVVGRFAGAGSRSSCHACALGRYSNAVAASACAQCSVGRYTSVTGSTACATCDLGQTAAIGTSSCTNCTAGTFGVNATNPQCEPCSAGYANLAQAATVCDACSPGQYTNVTGQPTCLSCSAGKYQPSSAAGYCFNCTAGYVQSTAGSSACVACNLGFHAPYTGMQDCPSCAPGHYTAQNATVACAACDIGTYTENYATTACETCMPGYFTAVTGTVACSLHTPPCNITAVEIVAPNSTTDRQCVNGYADRTVVWTIPEGAEFSIGIAQLWAAWAGPNWEDVAWMTMLEAHAMSQVPVRLFVENSTRPDSGAQLQAITRLHAQVNTSELAGLTLDNEFAFVRLLALPTTCTNSSCSTVSATQRVWYSECTGEDVMRQSDPAICEIRATLRLKHRAQVTEVQESPYVIGAVQSVGDHAWSVSVAENTLATQGQSELALLRLGMSDEMGNLTVDVASDSPGRFFASSTELQGCESECRFQLGWRQAFNYELAQQHTITLTLTDAIGQARVLTVRVDVTDVNERPQPNWSQLASMSIVENAPPGTESGVLAVDDEDVAFGTQRLRYDLINVTNGLGELVNLLALNTSTGMLSASQYASPMAHHVNSIDADYAGGFYTVWALVSEVSHGNFTVLVQAKVTVSPQAEPAMLLTSTLYLPEQACASAVSRGQFNGDAWVNTWTHVNVPVALCTNCSLQQWLDTAHTTELGQFEASGFQLQPDDDDVIESVWLQHAAGWPLPEMHAEETHAAASKFRYAALPDDVLAAAANDNYDTMQVTSPSGKLDGQLTWAVSVEQGSFVKLRLLHSAEPTDTECLNFEWRHNHTFYMVARSSNGLCTTGLLTVQLWDVNDPHTLAVDLPSGIARGEQNMFPGTLISGMTVTVTDEDEEELEFVVVDERAGTMDMFTMAPNTSVPVQGARAELGMTVLRSTLENGLYLLRIVVRDRACKWYAKCRSTSSTEIESYWRHNEHGLLLVMVKDENDIPELQARGAIQVPENSAVGTSLGVVSATDADMWQSIKFTVPSASDYISVHPLWEFVVVPACAIEADQNGNLQGLSMPQATNVSCDGDFNCVGYAQLEAGDPPQLLNGTVYGADGGVTPARCGGNDTNALDPGVERVGLVLTRSAELRLAADVLDWEGWMAHLGGTVEELTLVATDDGVVFHEFQYAAAAPQSATTTLNLSLVDAMDAPLITNVSTASPFGLTTGGGEAVTLIGQHFWKLLGPVAELSISALYATTEVSTVFMSQCAVRAANTRVECSSAPGWGLHHHWVVIGGAIPAEILDSPDDEVLVKLWHALQSHRDAGTGRICAGNESSVWHAVMGPQPAPSHAAQALAALIFSDVSRATTSYAPPAISSIDGAGAVDADTSGGQRVQLHGSQLGAHAELLSVQYRNAANELFQASNCTVVSPHATVECVTSPGRGSNLQWSISVGNVSSALPSTTYARPEIHNLTVIQHGATVYTSASQIAGDGSDEICLNGTHFGPGSMSEDRMQVLYGLANGDAFAGEVYEAQNCHLVAAQTSICCQTLPGEGSDLCVQVVVAGLTSQLSPDIKVDYAPPHLSLSKSGKSTVSTVGGDLSQWKGTNFGRGEKATAQPVVQLGFCTPGDAACQSSSMEVLQSSNFSWATWAQELPAWNTTLVPRMLAATNVRYINREQLQVEVLAGAGANVTARVSIAGVPSAPVPMVSYAPPKITGLTRLNGSDADRAVTFQVDLTNHGYCCLAWAEQLLQAPHTWPSVAACECTALLQRLPPLITLQRAAADSLLPESLVQVQVRTTHPQAGVYPCQVQSISAQGLVCTTEALTGSMHVTVAGQTSDDEAFVWHDRLPAGLKLVPLVAPSLPTGWRQLGAASTLQLKWTLPVSNVAAREPQAFQVGFGPAGSDVAAAMVACRKAGLTSGMFGTVQIVQISLQDIQARKLSGAENVTEYQVAVRGVKQDPQVVSIAAYTSGGTGPHSATSAPIPEACTNDQFLATHLQQGANMSGVVCLRCPQGAICAAGTWAEVVNAAGWWRVPWDPVGLTFQPCKVPEWCPANATSPSFEMWKARLLSDRRRGTSSMPANHSSGGAGGSADPASNWATSCAPGRRGTLCSLCEAGFAPNPDGSCSACQSAGAAVTASFIGGVLLLVILSGALVATTVRASRQGISSEPYVEAAKVLTSHLQLISLASTFQVAWGQTMQALYEGAAIVTSASSSLVQPECLTSSYASSLRPRLQLQVAGPAGLLLVFCVYFLARAAWKWRVKQKDMMRRAAARHEGSRARKSIVAAARSSKSARVWRALRCCLVALLVIGFLFQLSTVRAGLLALTCVDLSGRSVLLIEPSTACDAASATWRHPYGTAAIVVYGVCLPLLCVALLAYYRDRRDELVVREALAFLFINYRQTGLTFMWEVVEQLKRLLLAAIAVSVAPAGALVQLFAALLLLVLYAMLLLGHKPYRTASLNVIALCSALVAMLTLLAGQLSLSLADTQDDSKAATSTATLNTVMSIIVVVLNILFVLCTVVYAGWAAVKAHQGTIKHAARHALRRLGAADKPGADPGSSDDSDAVDGLSERAQRRDSMMWARHPAGVKQDAPRAGRFAAMAAAKPAPAPAPASPSAPSSPASSPGSSPRSSSLRHLARASQFLNPAALRPGQHTTKHVSTGPPAASNSLPASRRLQFQRDTASTGEPSPGEATRNPMHALQALQSASNRKLQLEPQRVGHASSTRKA